jgi:hypothetical protein
MKNVEKSVADPEQKEAAQFQCGSGGSRAASK